MMDLVQPICLFARLDWSAQGQPVGKLPGLLLQQILLGLAAALVLLLILVLWAKYGRNIKVKKRRAGGTKVFRGSPAPPVQEESAEDEEEDRRRYKYRWKRRKHRARKPTLAETGGLPPLRPEEKTSSS